MLARDHTIIIFFNRYGRHLCVGHCLAASTTEQRRRLKVNIHEQVRASHHIVDGRCRRRGGSNAGRWSNLPESLRELGGHRGTELPRHGHSRGCLHRMRLRRSLRPRAQDFAEFSVQVLRRRRLVGIDWGIRRHQRHPTYRDGIVCQWTHHAPSY